MNMKKTAVAFAVAGLVAAPVASKAEAEVYASIRQDLTFLVSNTADDTLLEGEEDVAGKLSLRNYGASRFGLRFTEEVEEGTKYFGRYEFGVGTQNGDPVGTRLAYAGVDYGAHQITVGSQWSAWYNYAGNTYGWLDGRYPIQDWSFRHRAVNWLGEFGPVDVTVDLIAGAAKTTLFDELQVGASFDLGAIDLVGSLRLIQDVPEASGIEDPVTAIPEDNVAGVLASPGGGQPAGTVIGLGVNWAVNDDYGLQFNIHISDGTNEVDSSGALIQNQGYTQLGVLATLPQGFWVGIGIANLDEAEAVVGQDGAIDGMTRITGGWYKEMSEHAAFFAEVVLDTTAEDHPYGAQGYTNLSAGWIMNF
jgi:predicted porin